MEVKIYVLIDPVTYKIRYIGRTKCSLNTRLNGHLSKSKFKNNHKDCWIQSLLQKGLIPKIKLFKKIRGWKESHTYEQELISKCLSFGFDLVNLDDRGEGNVNKIITAEQKQKIRDTLKEKYKSGKIKPTRQTPVTVFDLNGNFINSFISLTQCSERLKIPYSSLEKVLSKKVKRWKNYQITYGENPGTYFLKKDMSCLNKEVWLLDINTHKYIQFQSYKSLAEYLNTSTTQLRRYLQSGKVFRQNLMILCPFKIG
jgi:hypothetical protein